MDMGEFGFYTSGVLQRLLPAIFLGLSIFLLLISSEETLWLDTPDTLSKFGLYFRSRRTSGDSILERSSIMS
eukprot:CAMPEP_0168616258 /NCGR_PEP_ID=MMETSP0449_2-20121227/4936_1 /TAXON_ID=1082188 /ORGANISM="Strombidium rassoulzadegani, Strain ras09" /LENGTH=71 /DNA_ID=CAMNT_0008657041 /DNA_START=464 /DNA_END=679 /DNA_ORIENTATION=-